MSANLTNLSRPSNDHKILIPVVTAGITHLKIEEVVWVFVIEFMNPTSWSVVPGMKVTHDKPK